MNVQSVFGKVLREVLKRSLLLIWLSSTLSAFAAKNLLSTCNRLDLSYYQSIRQLAPSLRNNVILCFVW